MAIKNKIKKTIRKFISSSSILRDSETHLRIRYNTWKSKTIIKNNGTGILKKDIRGTGNRITIGKNTVLKGAQVYIRGNNNKLIIGENCHIGRKCAFWMQGNNITISIGKGTTMVHTIQINASEHNQKIIIGEDCMLSNTLIIRTSDDHPIYDIATGSRINPPKDVIIGNHVWIAPSSKIFKGAIIGDGAIIGSNALVTKPIESNSLALGIPAKVVKRGVKWTREPLF